jgi:hypothetical protein
MRIRSINISLLLVLVLCSCSDKYASLVALAPSPQLSFDRDTVVIREMDPLYFAGVLNPFVRMFSVPAPPQMNIQYYDPSGTVHFRYRGVQMEEGKAIIVAGDSTLLFCSCDTAGVYPIDFFLEDHLGKTDTRQLMIHCVGNDRPKADLTITLTDSSITDSWEYHFDGSGSKKLYGLIRGYYFTIDNQPVYAAAAVAGYVFHSRGEHMVSLYVTDDQDYHSDTIIKKILIP